MLSIQALISSASTYWPASSSASASAINSASQASRRFRSDSVSGPGAEVSSSGRGTVSMAHNVALAADGCQGAPGRMIVNHQARQIVGYLGDASTKEQPPTSITSQREQW